MLACKGHFPHACHLSAQVLVALCTLLSAALGRVPTAVLRSKFLPSSTILCSIIRQHPEQARDPAT